MANSPKIGLDDFFAAGATVADFYASVVDELPESEPEWETPIPLDDLKGDPFPTDALPFEMAEYCRAVAEDTQTPPDLTGIVQLGAISTAIGGKFVVQVEPNWSEPVHGQMITVMAPANRKSPVYAQVMSSIIARERKQALEDRKKLAAWQAERDIKEAKLKRLKAIAAGTVKPEGGAVPTDIDSQVTALAEELAIEQPPRITRFIVDDVTPEKLGTVAVEQRGRIAVCSPEGEFIVNLSRYSDVPNFGVVLHGHAGEEHRSDRVGRESEYVNRLCLTICIVTQPQTVKDLAATKGFVQKGGAARIWPSFPPSLVGFRKTVSTPVPIEMKRQWDALITQLLELEPSAPDQESTLAPIEPEPWVLTLSPEARNLHMAFREWVEPNLRDGGYFGASSGLQEWAGKLAGAAARIAGLLHVADNASESHLHHIPISGHTMESAIAIARYYGSHARIFFDRLGDRPDLEAARQVWEVLKGMAPETTKQRLYQRLRDRTAFTKASALDAPLLLLEDYGYIRVQKVESTIKATGRPGGRPSTRILINPCAENPQYPQKVAERPGIEPDYDNEEAA